MDQFCDIGVIGLSVMGKNLARNIEEHGFSAAVYNRSAEKTKELSNEAAGKNLFAFYHLSEFCAALKSPKKIIIMVKAGRPVDDTVEAIKPFLDSGDIIIDAGNSYYQDTMRRSEALSAQGFRFIGTGVSGGEEGARFGPAIMPGGDFRAYGEMEQIFTAIAAKAPDGTPCCAYIGENGAGHYVKMVHNGIEYADMQLISEAYYLMKNLLMMDEREMAETLSEWNLGELDSYLIKITADILKTYDPDTKKPMLDVILDSASQKGTGIWTAQDALSLGVCAPTIAEAVFSRCISARKDERLEASEIFPEQKAAFCGDKKEFCEEIRRALYASKICAYAQGFSLMKAASEYYGWSLSYGEIAMIFRGGCIIRARFLNRIKEAFDKNPGLPNLLIDGYFSGILREYQNGWRNVVAAAAVNGIAVPAFMSALSYFDACRAKRLPANMIQAQRDYFGAHTFKRLDRGGDFHFKWY